MLQLLSSRNQAAPLRPNYCSERLIHHLQSNYTTWSLVRLVELDVLRILEVVKMFWLWKLTRTYSLGKILTTTSVSRERHVACYQTWKASLSQVHLRHSWGLLVQAKLRY